MGRLQLVLLALALVVLGPDEAVGQTTSVPFATASSDWQGMTEFVRMAQAGVGTASVRVSSELDFDRLSPSDSVIIISPELQLDSDSLTAFLAAGGRVAILDDFGRSGSFLERFAVRRVAMNKAPRHSLRGDPDLALAVPSVESLKGAREGRHPIAMDVERVVTNHPMLLEHPNLTSVLEVPFADGTSGTLAVTGVISGKGRLLAIADPSIFINLMLRYPGNRQLAAGLFDYLTERSNGPSGTSRLWIVGGDFRQTGHFGATTSLRGEFTRRFDSVSQAVTSVNESGLPRFAALLLSALVALLALARELRRNTTGPLFFTPSYARPASLLGQTGPASRAEVLGSPAASPLLGVLEMEAALREAVEVCLGASSNLLPSELKEAVTARGLSVTQAETLVALLQQTRAIGTSLARGRPAHPSRTELKRLHERSMDLLTAIHNAERNQR